MFTNWPHVNLALPREHKTTGTNLHCNSFKDYWYMLPRVACQSLKPENGKTMGGGAGQGENGIKTFNRDNTQMEVKLFKQLK